MVKELALGTAVSSQHGQRIAALTEELLLPQLLHFLNDAMVLVLKALSGYCPGCYLPLQMYRPTSASVTIAQDDAHGQTMKQQSCTVSMWICT